MRTLIELKVNDDQYRRYFNLNENDQEWFMLELSNMVDRYNARHDALKECNDRIKELLSEIEINDTINKLKALPDVLQ